MIRTLELKSGIKMPIIGFGTWQLRGKECVKAVKDALKIGYSHIDTAEMYRNEEEIGEALKGIDRKKLFIVSKAYPYGLNYESVIEKCNASLSRLKIDYLDLYLIHWYHGSMNLKGALEGMKKLKDEGKIMSFGVSNFDISNLQEAMKICDEVRLDLDVN